MNEFLWQTFHRLIEESTVSKQRFLYDQLNVENRLTGIIGPRGIGKTTMLLQYIKNNLYNSGKAFYFSADNNYFNESSLLAFVDELYQTQNIRYFFIDEIHKYPNWDQELKNIYDSFSEIKIIFSGSSSINLTKGAYDLSRRAKLHYLPGLSFREYLNIETNNNFSVVSLEELILHHQKITRMFSSIGTIRKHFNNYMQHGYYPIVFENRENLHQAISNVIDKTIYEDIAKFYNLKTSNLIHFKRIINFLASIPPGRTKTNNIARHLQIDNRTVDHYIDILQCTGVIKMLMPQAHGNQLLTKPSKIFLDNSTLLTSVNILLSSPVDVGMQRELVFLQSLVGANVNVYFPQKGDFQVDDTIFEVGGKNKTNQQLKDQRGRNIIVRDQILFGSKNEIPLYLFGFLY